jgi:hypothetical protein
VYASTNGEFRMSRKSSYKEVLVDLLDRFLKTDNEEEIRGYLASNSNLPGPRGNLELAYAFAEVAEDCSARDPHKMWELASRLVSVSPEEAPVNNPKEFLPFCGAIILGAIGSVYDEFCLRAYALLKRLANDPRWRTREGVAMGIQRLVARRGLSAFKELSMWIAKNDWLAMRAVAAGVAEPALLRDKQNAGYALELHKMIFTRIFASGDRKTVEFKTLRKTLGYSLSVVTNAAPKEGFGYIRRIINTDDADVQWVIKENLTKNRLVKNFPKDVDATKELLLRKYHR